MTKSITATKQNSIPYPMGGLSTCNDFLAIGDYGAPVGTGAAIRLYDVSNSCAISRIGSIIPDQSTPNVYSLDKCCAGNPQYLLAGMGDPDTYTLYVLTTSANPAPLPPTNTQGMQMLHRFPMVGDLINILTWQPAAAQTGTNPAASYEIFLFPNLDTPIATISANQPLTYADHNKQCGVQYTYYIYAVDSQGRMSEPVFIRVPSGTRVVSQEQVSNSVIFSIIAREQLGNFVNSVSWCCNGINNYLAVTYNNGLGQAGEIYQLDTAQTPPLIDLGPITYTA